MHPIHAIGRALTTLFTAASLMGFACFLVLPEPTFAPSAAMAPWLIGGWLALTAALFTLPWERRRLLATRVGLVLLPIWGAAANAQMRSCDACGTASQPLYPGGMPQVYLAYGAGLLAWSVHRRRRQMLPWLQEGALLAGLVVGIVTCAALALHFGAAPAMAFMAPQAGPALFAPLIGLVAFCAALIGRLHDHGQGALPDPEKTALAAVFGEGSAVVVDTVRVAGRSPGAAAAWLVTLWAGASVSLTHLMTGGLGLYGGAFAKTCEWNLSQQSPIPRDCHYLCTVAARGHAWLVRPERLGRRRGRVIVVNRQLAVANAFEDLLHERWPRFGRGARATYDRMGWPLSRYIRSPWASDAVYLVMLPAQLVFLLALLLLDPGDPEARVDRMYR